MSDVSGQIIDYFTGRGIEGATVMFGATLTTTDANGNYALYELTPDFYTITVIHRDYEQTVLSTDLRANVAYALEPIKVKPVFKAL